MQLTAYRTQRIRPLPHSLSRCLCRSPLPSQAPAGEAPNVWMQVVRDCAYHHACRRFLPAHYVRMAEAVAAQDRVLARTQAELARTQAELAQARAELLAIKSDSSQ